jgi:hypothetical protein
VREIGIQKARMTRVQHTEAPWSAGQRGQVLPVSVEIRASVEFVQWSQRRALQEVTEEWEVRGICMTKRSGLRVVWQKIHIEDSEVGKERERERERASKRGSERGPERGRVVLGTEVVTGYVLSGT